MKKALVHHRSIRTMTIYDGSIRNPRTGVDDNKSVGLKINTAQAVSLVAGITKYLTWNTLRKLVGRESAPLLITSYKYNKGPAGHATTLTSHVKR